MGGKAEKGTPKYIANKIKAKGLQKLRWYCQMCQKQCRDENGFKCHTMSESHQRQLLLFADNSTRYLDEFSREFSDGYLEQLKRQFGTKRVNANKVYQEYISNRDHCHMNSTQWETLTEFVKWLGREGKCVVDETEKGWFVAYIDRDPAAVAALEAQAKKEKMDKDDQERMQEFIARQVVRGKTSFKADEPSYTELKRSSSQERLTLNMTLKRKLEEKKLESLPSFALKLPKKEDKLKKTNKPEAESSTSKQSALDDIIKMEERAKEKANSRVILRSSYEQIEIMVDFMERHGDLSLAGYGLRGPYHMTSVKWRELTKKLNGEGSGDSRSEEKWRKVWSDLKNNMKKKAAKTTELSFVDRRIMAVIRKRDGLDGSFPPDGFHQKPSEVAEPQLEPVVLVDVVEDKWNQPDASNNPLQVRTPSPEANLTRVEYVPPPTPQQTPAEESEKDVVETIFVEDEWNCPGASNNPLQVRTSSPEARSTRVQYVPAPTPPQQILAEESEADVVSAIFVKDEWNSPGASNDPLQVKTSLPAVRSTRVQSLPALTTARQAPARKSETFDRNEREIEIEREKLRLREIELNLQGQWLQVMREGLSVLREYLAGNKRD